VVDDISITGNLIDPDIQKVEQNPTRELGEFTTRPWRRASSARNSNQVPEMEPGTPRSIIPYLDKV
jgi:hypothetical protein